MTKKQENRIIATVGTVLFMGLVVLLLWLIRLNAEKSEKQDYVEVVFEDMETPEPEIPKVRPEPALSKTVDPGQASPSQSQPNDQPSENSAEQVVSEQEQLLAIQQAKADSIAEANRQAKKKAEDLIGGFTFTDTPDNGTAANQTNPNGKGSAHKGEGADGENKWSLAGRGLVGNLPKPKDTFNQAGKVVVQISVDASGKVTEATVIGGDISDKATMQLAIDAAMKAKFTSDKSIKQVGTITYTFKFN